MTFVPTFEECRRYYESRPPGQRIGSRREVAFKCLFHPDGKASGNVNLEQGTWFCHTCNIGGGILDFERRLTGEPDAECWAAINSTIGREDRKSDKAKRKIIIIYDYLDASGRVHYQVVRFEPKDFRQRRPNGKGGWIWNMDGVTLVPFNLPAVVRANVVLIAEGEKDALNLQKAAADFPDNDGKLSYASTCNVGGAGKWSDDYSPSLSGKMVFEFPHNDEPGRKHAQQVCASASKYAQGVHLVELPGLSEHGDVSDYLQTHTPSELFALMQRAPLWAVPAHPPSKPPLAADEAATLTSGLLETVYRWIRRFVIVTREQAIVMAFWVLHTYVMDAAEWTPYLHITAPEKETGKTLLMEVLAPLTSSPRTACGTTPAALLRIVDKYRPTLFLDEIDASTKGDKDMAVAQRGILNAGFKRGGVFYKCDGKDHEVRAFNAFGPKCFAGIGDLPDTVASRSIIIEMRRKLRSETVERHRSRKVDRFEAPIRAELDRWAAGVIDLLKPIEPELIDALHDRANDVAEILLAIAQIAGADWLKRLTNALIKVYGADAADDTSTGVILLSDIRDIFAVPKQPPHLPSKELAAALNEIEGRPWAEWSRGKGFSANQLARQLKKYHIHPHVITPSTTTSFRGYETSDFADAWNRYCPSPPPQSVKVSEPVSPLHETPISKCKESSASYGCKIAETRMNTEDLHFDGSIAGGTGKESQNGTAPEQGKEVRV